MITFIKQYAWILVLIVIGFAYAEAYYHSYVWDDWIIFADNPRLRHPENLWQAIASPVLVETTYFRPTVLLTFVLEHRLFAALPAISHLINLLIFAVNTLLVYLLARQLMGAGRAGLVMLLYALHPALIEPASWVSGRFDLLMTTFALATLLSVSHFSGFKRLLFSGLFFLLAAGCKEMAVTLPILVFIWLWIYGGTEKSIGERLKMCLQRPELALYAVLIATGLFYLLLRYSAFSAFMHMDDDIVDTVGFVDRVSLVGNTLLFYLKLIFLPFVDVNPIHRLSIQEYAFIDTLTGILALLAALFITYWWIKKPTKSRLLFLAGIIALLPVLNLIPLTISGNIGHDRFLTLPLVFFVLAVVSFDFPSLEMSEAMESLLPKLLAAALVLWSLLCFLTIRTTVPLWADSFSLWSWVYSKNPNYSFVQANFLFAAMRKNDLETAGRLIDAFDANQSESKRYLVDEFVMTKGQYLLRTGEADTAIALISEFLLARYGIAADFSNEEFFQRQKISALAPDRAIRFGYQVLADAFLTKQKYRPALAAASIAEFYGTNLALVSFFQAMAYYGLDQVSDAERHFNRALELAWRGGTDYFIAERERHLNEFCEGNPALQVCEK